MVIIRFVQEYLSWLVSEKLFHQETQSDLAKGRESRN